MKNDTTDDVRGSGKTRHAIMTAPKDSLYLCVNRNHVLYCKQLADHLERSDITFQCPDYIEQRRLAGSTKEVVIDHAAELDGRQWQEYELHKIYMALHK